MNYPPQEQPQQRQPQQWQPQQWQPQQWQPQPQWVQVQPLPVVLQCPYCHNYGPVLIQQRISTAGWITFAVLLIVFFPLFWIGLLIKENYHMCSHCGLKLG